MILSESTYVSVQHIPARVMPPSFVISKSDNPSTPVLFLCS